MSVESAIYQAVHEYPGGVDRLAQHMGLAASTVRCMANPNDPTHEFNLRRFRQLIDLSRDTGPLEAVCEENGGVFVRMPRAADGSLDELMVSLVKMAREFGDVPRVIEESGGDKSITPKELAKIRREVYELQAAAAAVLKVVEQMARPAPLRAVGPAA